MSLTIVTAHRRINFASNRANFITITSIEQARWSWYGDLDAEITNRIQSGWKNWKRVSGILCDRRISLRFKGKVYKTVVRPAMMYGAETCAVKKTQEQKLDVAEMRMLRWMSGVTKLDRIRNERIRGTTKVGEISKKVQESRLKWYGHVLRREDEYVGKRVVAMEVPGKRRRGRPKRRWMDTIGNDLSQKELQGRTRKTVLNGGVS